MFYKMVGLRLRGRWWSCETPWLGWDSTKSNWWNGVLGEILVAVAVAASSTGNSGQRAANEASVALWGEGPEWAFSRKVIWISMAARLYPDPRILLKCVQNFKSTHNFQAKSPIKLLLLWICSCQQCINSSMCQKIIIFLYLSRKYICECVKSWLDKRGCRCHAKRQLLIYIHIPT